MDDMGSKWDSTLYERKHSPEAAVKSIYLALRSGGRFVAEFGGKGNNASMLRALRSSFRSQGYERNAKINFWYYPSIAEYSILLERHGFYVRKALHFHRETELDGPEGMRNWFRMFGNQFFAGLSDSEMDAVLTDVENQLRPTHFRNGRWYADYKRIRIVATKDDGEFA
ncbi:MAG: hypothetical protein HYZ72_10190 [Deltaproteobacteria bacterium]|nr:hypothetical protein [Deltaproteobacteria bacterium]